MRLLLPVVAATLVGCNPIVYVPAPIPAAPQQPGLRVGVGANALGGQGVGQLSIAPAEGLALYSQGLIASSLDDGEGAASYAHLGGEIGVLAGHALGPSAQIDLGVAVGRDRIDATRLVYDVGCCSGSYRPVEARVERVGAHLGVFFRDGSTSGERFRIGPAVRVVHVSAEREGGGSPAQSVFVEPALRSGFVAGRVEFQFQAGLSLEASGDLLVDYSTIPAFAGGVLSFRLDG